MGYDVDDDDTIVILATKNWKIMMMIQLSFWQTKLGVFTLSKDTDDGKKGREKESATRLNTNTNRFKI